MSSVTRSDQEFAAFIAWLQANGLEAVTSRVGTVIYQRRPKRSRLTGEPR